MFRMFGRALNERLLAKKQRAKEKREQEERPRARVIPIREIGIESEKSLPESEEDLYRGE